MTMKPPDELKEAVERDAGRWRKARDERPSLIGLMLYGGTLGILFAVPLVGGAYLGRWLDSLAAGYSVRWTVSCIVLGVAAGAWNVYWFLRNR